MSETKYLLSAESLDLLKKCKGKTIVGIGSLNESETDATIWSLTIKFDDGSIDELSVVFKDMQLLGKNETISCFDYKSVGSEKNGSITRTVKPLLISRIEIYTEKIISTDAELGDDTIVLDSGIQFGDDAGNVISFTLGKEYYDDDWIGFGEGKTIDDLRPLGEVADSWGDGIDGHSVKVERSVRQIA